MDDSIAELRLQMAQLELRVTRWTVVCAILTIAVVIVLVLPTLRGPALGFFVLGTVIQCVAIWRIGTTTPSS